MATYKEAFRVRSSMKMAMSQHAWYCGSRVLCEQSDYHIIINVKAINNAVKKVVPPVVNGVSIRLELDKG